LRTLIQETVFKFKKMLDLNKLSQQLDEALEKETSESLMKWLMSKRASAVNEYIGEGNFFPINVNEYTESVSADLLNFLVDAAASNAGNTQYAMAA